MRAANAPHALTVDPAFGTERACAACHQFAFADGRADLVKRTLEEHDASELASTPCQQCHMAERGPRRKGHFEEDFALPSDAAIARVRYVLLFERVLAQRGAEVSLVSSDAIAEGLAD